MTHPKRVRAAHQVLAGLAPLERRLAIDPEPDGPPSSLRSAQRAFAAAAPGSTHHLVLQDDASLSEGFVAAIEQSVALHPNAAISFFAEWGSRTAMLARWAVLMGTTWVPVIDPYVPTLALVMPSHLAVELGRFLGREANPGEADDQAVLRFISRTGTPALVVVPNLTEHLNLPSLAGNEDHGDRRSVCFVPGNPPVLNAKILDMPRLVPSFSWVRGVSIIIDTDNYVSSTWRPTVAVLAEWGVDQHELLTAYWSTLSSRQVPENLRAGVSDRYLFELWITAVAMGAIQQNQWPASVAALEFLLNDPMAAQAFHTMAPGALRRFVDLDLLTRYADELDDLMVAAMKYGAERCVANLVDVDVPPSA